MCYEVWFLMIFNDVSWSFQEILQDIRPPEPPATKHRCQRHPREGRSRTGLGGAGATRTESQGRGLRLNGFWQQEFVDCEFGYVWLQIAAIQIQDAEKSYILEKWLICQNCVNALMVVSAQVVPLLQRLHPLCPTLPFPRCGFSFCPENVRYWTYYEHDVHLFSNVFRLESLLGTAEPPKVWHPFSPGMGRLSVHRFPVLNFAACILHTVQRHVDLVFFQSSFRTMRIDLFNCNVSYAYLLQCFLVRAFGEATQCCSTSWAW